MISDLLASGRTTAQSTASPSTSTGSRVSSVKPRPESNTSTRTSTGSTEAESGEEQQEKSGAAEKAPCVEGELADSSQEKLTDGKVSSDLGQKKLSLNSNKYKQHADFLSFLLFASVARGDAVCLLVWPPCSSLNLQS